MHKVFRFGTIILLPLVTLFLGWQIGASYEQKSLVELSERLELLYTGKTASGTLLGDPEKEVDLSLLWGVWRMLLKHYIHEEQLNPPDMIYGAVGGLVRAVGDPYTTFMTPTENKQFTQSLQGVLEGIGAELTMRDGMVVVVAPLKGSPASKAGLEPEDIIVAVDEVDIEGETLHQVVQRIRGPKESKVTLSIEREEAPDLLDITITRASITVPSVEYEIKETATGSIGYIQINQFGEDSVREVKNALKDLRDEDLHGLIIDVRYNGGGYLEGAVDMVSMFLKEGKVVTVERRNGEPSNHYVSGRPSDPEIPLVILINEGSASASEILAGALQDAGRATIIGKKSFGKGTVQEVFDLPGNASVRITVARWLTPSGRDLGKEGVIPDIDVDRTREQISDLEDPQLDAAMEFLLEGEGQAN
ncbi:MAG: S41 family peptidase [Patescibacteria group bacterium]